MQSNNEIYAINGTTGTIEPAPAWIAETGIMHYEQRGSGVGYLPIRYISRFNIRLNMAKGTRIQMFIEYDSKGPWIFAGNVEAGDIATDNTGSAMIPVRPRRCDHLRLRLEGKGDVRILSIARVLEKGSDMR